VLPALPAQHCEFARDDAGRLFRGVKFEPAGKVLGDPKLAVAPYRAYSCGTELRAEDVVAVEGRVHESRMDLAGLLAKGNVLAAGVKAHSRTGKPLRERGFA